MKNYLLSLHRLIQTEESLLVGCSREELVQYLAQIKKFFFYFKEREERRGKYSASELGVIIVRTKWQTRLSQNPGSNRAPNHDRATILGKHSVQ